MSSKKVVSVSEMAEMCGFSRSRWYEFTKAGVFPEPVQLPSMKRPVYDQKLIAQCLEICQSGVGLNGPVTFNRKRKKVDARRTEVRQFIKQQSASPLIKSLVNALRDLGLSSTPDAVNDAVAAVFPGDITGVDEAELVRKIFLHMQSER